ncbi:MAG: hypothetical protein AMJ65_09675 [Phycisphaerae bacterium SG8_4]|nr:MAG: hypothetical protein AMJ65_09675 [Phycisphaerae bacterium SG8_4]
MAGKARQGAARLGVARQGKAGMARQGVVWLAPAGRGMAGKAWRGGARLGEAGRDKAWHGNMKSSRPQKGKTDGYESQVEANQREDTCTHDRKHFYSRATRLE